MAPDDETLGEKSAAAKELEAVIRKISDFEQQKLPEVKRELEAFVAKQEKADGEYKKAYPDLRDWWCRQQTNLEGIDARIKRYFPSDAWKKTIVECICEPERTIYCLEQSIELRRQCCQGKLERAQWEAQRALQAAKAHLDGLTANVAGLKGALGANETAIGEVNKLLDGPDKALALYPFFFQLIAAHAKLAPKDLKPFGAGVSPAELCKDAWKDCSTDDAPCKPVTTPPVAAAAGRSAPWLVYPDDYVAALDEAWDAYHKAKDALTQAEMAYKAAPDDLASREKQLPEAKKKAAEDIKKCLTAKTPEDPCPKPSATAED